MAIHPSICSSLARIVKHAKARKKTVFPLDDDGDDSTQVSEILRMGKPYSNRCRRSTLKYQIREQPRLLFFECLLPMLALFLCNKQKIAPLFTFFQVIINVIHILPYLLVYSILLIIRYLRVSHYRCQQKMKHKCCLY